MADREVDPWVFSRKGKLGGSDVLIGGVGASRPNVSEMARMLVKSRSCCKRSSHGAMVYSVILLLFVTVYFYH